MKVTKLDPMDPHSNPFDYDLTNMGYEVGSNVTIMFPGFQKDHQPFMKVFDRTTGEVIKIEFAEETP